jgi:hypothetical protein
MAKFIDKVFEILRPHMADIGQVFFYEMAAQRHYVGKGFFVDETAALPTDFNAHTVHNGVIYQSAMRNSARFHRRMGKQKFVAQPALDIVQEPARTSCMFPTATQPNSNMLHLSPLLILKECLKRIEILEVMIPDLANLPTSDDDFQKEEEEDSISRHHYWCSLRTPIPVRTYAWEPLQTPTTAQSFAQISYISAPSGCRVLMTFDIPIAGQGYLMGCGCACLYTSDVWCGHPYCFLESKLWQLCHSGLISNVVGSVTTA